MPGTDRHPENRIIGHKGRYVYIQDEDDHVYKYACRARAPRTRFPFGRSVGPEILRAAERIL